MDSTATPSAAAVVANAPAQGFAFRPWSKSELAVALLGLWYFVQMVLTAVACTSAAWFVVNTGLALIEYDLHGYTACTPYVCAYVSYSALPNDKSATALGRLTHAAAAMASILSAAIVLVAIGVTMRLRGHAPNFLRGLCLSPARGGCYLLSLPALVSMSWASFVLSVLAVAFWLFGPQYTFSPGSLYEYKRQGVGFNCLVVSMVFSLAAGISTIFLDKGLTGRPGVGAAPGSCSYYVTPGAPDGSERQLPVLATGANILPAVSAAYAATEPPKV